MLTAEDNATLVRAYYDAFNRRDFDKSLAMVTEDVTWTNIPFDATFTGRKGFREFVHNWTTAMPDIKVEVLNVVVGDAWAAVEFVGRGTHAGPLVGPLGVIPASHQKVELKCCEMLRLEDGQILEARLYFDAATLMRQLGPVAPEVGPNGLESSSH